MAVSTAQVPTSAAARGGETPTRCSRHGSLATVNRRVRILRAPAWVAAAGGAVLCFAVMVFSDKVVSPSWPFCDECRCERTLRLTVGAALCGVAPLPCCALLVTAPVASFAGPGLVPVLLSALTSIVLLLAGLGCLITAGWQALCGAFVSRGPLPRPGGD